MKRNKERKYIWHFLNITVIISVILALLMPGSSTFANYNKTDRLQAFMDPFIASKSHDFIYIDNSTIFTIENPPVDFEVVDADPFDGIGDNGPYSTFNDALLGTLGECRSMAEFDISPFTIPPETFIIIATFEVIITEIDVYGLGVDGETPDSLAVDGYVGNGLEELSDFEAGDGNILDSIDIPDPHIGQVLSFNVTSFVTDLINAQEQYVGLTIRAETFGGLWVTEGDVYPKLTIEIQNEPPNTPSDPSGPAFLIIDESGTYSTNATDPDGDQVQYRFDWDANGSHDYSDWTDFVSSGTTLNMNHSWSNGGSYVVKAQARDTYNETSGWSNGLSVYVNSPPYSPSDPEPEDGATDVDVNADISWSCSDPDDDNITYDIYFEAYDSTPDELVSNNQTECWFDPGTMDYSTHYYWQIIAWDEYGLSTEGIVWDFITGSEPNNPPFPPIIYEENESLFMFSIDPDGDDIFYLIDWGDGYIDDWFGPYLSGEILEINHEWSEPGTYEIKAKAKDIHGAESNWSEPYIIIIENHAPYAPTITGITSGRPNIAYDFTFNAIDPDRDNIRYIINWDDGNMDTTGFNLSGADVNVSHSWSGTGSYECSVHAEDKYGALGNETTFTIIIKKSKSIQNNLLLKILERFQLIQYILQKFEL